ncbi:MAG: hypothetical protein WED00_00930 [Aquisalimonadaceae bacterium]
MKKIVLLSAFSMMLAGCAGQVIYYPPSERQAITNSITVDSPMRQVWQDIIPGLGSSFFVVNNLDKDSGFINVSYSGSPEKYIDCGRIESHVKNARGERNYDFPAAAAYREYETFVGGQNLLFIRRNMELDGRINIVLQEVNGGRTLVTVNSRYIVTKSGTISNPQGQSQTYSDSISFNTNGSARYPQETTCYATGALEREVIKAMGLQ